MIDLSKLTDEEREFWRTLNELQGYVGYILRWIDEYRISHDAEKAHAKMAEYDPDAAKPKRSLKDIVEVLQKHEVSSEQIGRISSMLNEVVLVEAALDKMELLGTAEAALGMLDSNAFQLQDVVQSISTRHFGCRTHDVAATHNPKPIVDT